ncbi:Colicin-D [Serratia ficaria]|uniref:colicin E3/pyocin S6 family cytotoxin n=1 Tax=Serratia ficaria TaxID=61651 RepID=UPI00217728F0|nr:colicin E3/pyocin S6 family cytotoxin [Serratia ficaria]CAI1872722.1 Colicin-D [Serratia ficaria]
MARYEDTTQFERDVMTSMGYVWRGEGWQRGFSDNEGNMLVEAWVGGPPKKPEPLTNVFDKIADINKPISMHPENDDVVPFGDEAKKIYRDDANKAINLASGIVSDLERKMQETDRDIANVNSKLAQPQRTELEKASLNLVLSKLKVKQERLNVLHHSANKIRAHEEYIKYFNEEMFMAYDATSWRDNYRKENSQKMKEKRHEEQQYKISTEAARQRVSVLENEQREKENEVNRLKELEFAAEEARIAEAARKSEEARKVLFSKAGVLDAPVYTPEKVKAANAALAAAIVLNRAGGMVQLSTVANGVMMTSSELAGWVAGALWRGAVSVAGVATASTMGATVGAFAVGFWPGKVGEGSDRVPGRNIEIFAAQASLFAADKTAVQPEMNVVDLPVRGFITTGNNGQQEVILVKTGSGGVSASVPVYRPARDEKTGLDRITLPAVVGAPSRTVLVNPAPAVPMAPPHTGNNGPVPVTRVHTGTDIKQADSIVTTTFPANDIPPLQDFIYWQPDASGTGVESIYVIVSEPRKGVKDYGHDYHRPPNTADIKGLGELKPVPGKTPKQGGTGRRNRWKGDKGRKIYEWDSQHGELEGYRASDGSHLGAFDPKTGEQVKDPDPKRNIKKYL